MHPAGQITVLIENPSSENFVAQFTGKTYKYLQNTLILSNIHVGNENGQRFCLGCDTK